MAKCRQDINISHLIDDHAKLVLKEGTPRDSRESLGGETANSISQSVDEIPIRSDDLYLDRDGPIHAMSGTR